MDLPWWQAFDARLWLCGAVALWNVLAGRGLIRQDCTDRYSSQFENNCFTEMCSGSEAGSYLRLIDFVYHSTLGSRVTKKKRGGHGAKGGSVQFPQHTGNL